MATGFTRLRQVLFTCALDESIQAKCGFFGKEIVRDCDCAASRFLRGGVRRPDIWHYRQ